MLCVVWLHKCRTPYFIPNQLLVSQSHNSNWIACLLPGYGSRNVPAFLICKLWTILRFCKIVIYECAWVWVLEFFTCLGLITILQTYMIMCHPCSHLIVQVWIWILWDSLFVPLPFLKNGMKLLYLGLLYMYYCFGIWFIFVWSMPES